MTSRGIFEAAASVCPITSKPTFSKHRPGADERHREVHPAVGIHGVGLDGQRSLGHGVRDRTVEQVGGDPLAAPATAHDGADDAPHRHLVAGDLG